MKKQLQKNIIFYLWMLEMANTEKNLIHKLHYKSISHYNYENGNTSNNHSKKDCEKKTAKER